MFTVTAANRPSLFRLLSPKSSTFIKGAPVLTEISAGAYFYYGIPCQICTRHGVFIAANMGELPAAFLGKRCVAIIDSSNGPLRIQTAKQKFPALTCGRLSADSFTFSSWQNDRAVISLLRPLNAFDGTIVEPFELPVEYDLPPEPFDLLACAAVYSLLGQKSPLSTLEVWRPFALHLS